MKGLRFLLGVPALIGLALALVGCARSNGATRANRALPTASGRLTVLVTGTVWANLEPCG